MGKVKTGGEVVGMNAGGQRAKILKRKGERYFRMGKGEGR